MSKATCHICGKRLTPTKAGNLPAHGNTKTHKRCTGTGNKAVTTLGQPTKLTPETLAQIVKYARAGARDKTIAHLIKVSPAAFCQWKRWGDLEQVPRETEHMPKDRQPYVDFLNQLNDARAQPVMLSEATWLRAIQEGDWKAAQAWLKIHEPELYRETLDVELGGPLGEAAREALDAIREQLARGDE